MSVPKCPTCGLDYKADTTAYTPNCNCGNIFTTHLLARQTANESFEINRLEQQINYLIPERDRLTKENKTLRQKNDNWLEVCEALKAEVKKLNKDITIRKGMAQITSGLCLEAVLDRAEKAEADQATRAEAVAALIRDCETAEKERDAAKLDILELWKLLDDISTAGDMFKPSMTPYFKFVNSACEKRGNVATSDGYKVFYKGEALNHKEG